MFISNTVLAFSIVFFIIYTFGIAFLFYKFGAEDMQDEFLKCNSIFGLKNLYKNIEVNSEKEKKYYKREDREFSI